jgi:hypothetical protein
MMRKRKRDFTELNDFKLSQSSLANLFTVINDLEYRYSLTRTLYINGSEIAIPNLYNEHQFTDGDHWTLLSHKYYGTVELWWLICKFNGIVNPFILPEVGAKIKIPTEEFVQYVLQQLQAG